MNKLTIQINNLEALERLIGGDSEVEIEIRNSVVQKFTEKHLKPLVNDPVITTTLATIKDEITKQIKEKCEKEITTFKNNWYGSISEVKLNPSIKSEIDSHVRTLTDDTIRKSVEDGIKIWANDAELKTRINNRFEYYTRELINNEIKARIDKLKAKL